MEYISNKKEERNIKIAYKSLEFCKSSLKALYIAMIMILIWAIIFCIIDLIILN